MRNENPTFLYPTSRQFPVDEVCEQIVRRVEANDWRVPGGHVHFYTFGGYRMVGIIESTDFRLWFNRPQRIIDSLRTDYAAVNYLNIPGKELRIFEDETGPVLYLYVGEDWERDKADFTHGLKVHAKLNHRPRTYIKYEGSTSLKQHTWLQGLRPTYLVPTDDWDREYVPLPGEPMHFVTEEIMQEFASWLTEWMDASLPPLKSQQLTHIEALT